MTPTREAKKIASRVIDDSLSNVSVKDRIIQSIYQIDPSFISETNELDVRRLSEIVNGSSSHTNKVGYELQFVGKNTARYEADSSRTHEVKPVRSLSLNFKNTQNVAMIGDNLLALKILHQNYFNRVKMIYIDPPYNRDSDGFVYSDQFRLSSDDLKDLFGCDDSELQFISNTFQSRTHSGWLAFMYSRLKLARDLLVEDGVMFVSIDDFEMADLNIVCKEIFGESNVDCFVWRKSGSGRDGKMKNTNTFRKDHEYILVIYKQEKTLNKAFDYPRWENQYPNPDNDPRGPYKPGSISRTEAESKTDHKFFYEVTSPSGKKFERQFEVSREEFQALDDDNRIYWGTKGDAVPCRKIFEGEKREVNSSSILEDGTTTEGSKELDDVLSVDGMGREFRPKPVALIKKLVQLGTDVESGDIVLDFFAGTGTTADAVMQLNAEDGGNRKFVLVQLNEPVLKNKSPKSYQYLKSNNTSMDISSIMLMRLRESGIRTKNGNQPFVEEVDIGYRVFRLIARPSVKAAGSTKELNVQINSNRKCGLDTFFNLLCASGRRLDESFEVIQNNCLYKVEDDYYVVAPESVDSVSNSDGRLFYVDGWGEFDLQVFVDQGLASKLIVVY